MRGLIAFLVGFAGVQLYATIGAPRPKEPGTGAPQYAETDVPAPPPSQLTTWSFVLGGTSSSQADWASLAEGAVGIRSDVNLGDAAWVDAVVALESPFFEVDDRLACAARYGSSIESHCSVRFDIGIQRESSTVGRVVYSRGTPVMEGDSPAERAACELFLKCMTHGKLGGIVPIPKADWSEIVVYQLIGLLPMAEDLRVPENLRVQATWSDDYRREIARQIRDGETDPSAFLEAKMLNLEDKARYLRWRAEKFEDEEEEGR